MTTTALSVVPDIDGLDPDPRRSATLPSWLYTDPSAFAREMPAIHHRSWHYLAHASELAEPGCYATGWIADQAVFAIRGSDGVVRGFHNVCQHRAHQLLAEGHGQRAVITCPYHAWAYGTDGRLRTARGAEAVEGFDPAAFGLSPVKVETWLGFVFANLDPNAAPLAPQIADLEAELTRLVPRIAHSTKIAEVHYPIKANWKVYVENSIECFHCEPCHPGFSNAVDLDTYRVGGQWPIVTHTSAVRGMPSEGFGENGRALGRFLYWYLWPTTQCSVTTSNRTFQVSTMRVVDAEHLVGTEHVFAFEGERFNEDEIESIRLQCRDSATLAEDVAICETVQRGLHSRGYTQSRFVALDTDHHTSEHMVHRFHIAVAEAMGRPGTA